MITIVVTHEDDQSDEIDFSPSQPTITIGRRSSNDVCIPNLSVSGRHARIAFSKGEAWVEDLNSTNGTYINNRLISRQILNNSDELVIGKTRVRFYDSSNKKSALRAEPADVIDIRETESAQVAAPAAEDVAQYDDIEVLDASAEIDMSDTGGSPMPNIPYDDEGFDEHLDANTPARKTSRAPLAAGAAAAGGVAAGAAAMAASARQSASDVAASPESMFDDVAGKLSGRESNDYSNIAADDVIPGGAVSSHMDDSGEISLAERAKAALGRESNATSRDVNGGVNGGNHKAKADSATIEIKNGAKSGHVIPIDKPVTTLGRPGIQIAAIMRKPDGYFLMHIESNDSVDRPTLNNDFIGDEPMLLHPGDELNVAGINVEFDLVAQSVTTSV